MVIIKKIYNKYCISYNVLLQTKKCLGKFFLYKNKKKGYIYGIGLYL